MQQSHSTSEQCNLQINSHQQLGGELGAVSSQIQNNQNQSKIRYIKYGYYTNPQWVVFSATYILAILVVILLWTQVFRQGIHLYIGRTCCLYVLYRFLSLAFSNPGLANDPHSIENSEIKELETHQILSSQRYCKICHIQRERYMRHCNICNACIKEYDHHCVFIGKCIGKNNMGQFKDFLCMTFSTLIYGVIVSLITPPITHKAHESITKMI